MNAVETMERSAPVWDLTSYFPEFDGAAMRDFKHKLREDLLALQTAAAQLGSLQAENAGQWEAVVCQAEDFNVRLIHIYSFVSNLNAADTSNESYSAELAALSTLLAGATKAEVDLMSGLRDCSDSDFELLLGRPGMAGAAYYLTRLRQKAQHTMSTPEEKLAADLGVDGLSAWGRLYDNISGKLEFEMQWPDGRQERLPISRWRALMADTDREIGRRAFEGGNRIWQSVEVPCAAALNAIAGWRLTLNKRRRWNHVLDVATFQAGIQRQTLDAMYEAIHANIDVPRSYFIAKGKALGQSGIAWYEREAPLPLQGSTALRSWDEGSAMVQRAFDQSYPGLGKYYSDFLNWGWLEAQSRPGKRPGAYCTGSPLTREQRVYMTYNGTLGDIGTIAHELGHAWHSWILREQRPVARQYPMTLAETASIFAEHILSRGLQSDESVSDTEKLMLLDDELSGAAIMLDIAVRFEFEKAFYAERENGEVSVSRLKDLMEATQRRIWGEALRPDGSDPYFWASKLHFYIPGTVFYNYPYTFGFLLARSLSNMLSEQGPQFLSRYEDFLRLTGSDTAENVARRSLGVDLSQPEFWAGAINSLRPQVERYKELSAKLL